MESFKSNLLKWFQTHARNFLTLCEVFWILKGVDEEADKVDEEDEKIRGEGDGVASGDLRIDSGSLFNSRMIESPGCDSSLSIEELEVVD